MNYIIITDIFGNKIVDNTDNNNLPFIVLHAQNKYNTYNTQNILENTQHSSSIGNIWKPNQLIIFKILKSRNIDPINFSYVGDTHYASSRLPENIIILLVNNNKNISCDPVNYIEIEHNIWKPVCSQEYQGVGLIVSQSKPAKNAIKVINKKYLSEYKQLTNNIDEFNLLSNIKVKKYIINRSRLIPQYASPKQHTKNSSKWKLCKGNKVTLEEPELPWYVLKQNENKLTQ